MSSYLLIPPPLPPLPHHKKEHSHNITKERRTHRVEEHIRYIGTHTLERIFSSLVAGALVEQTVSLFPDKLAACARCRGEGEELVVG